MSPVIVRNVKIGEGSPKICVPIVAEDEASMEKMAESICGLPMDLVEWRVDWFQQVMCREKVLAAAGKLREILGEIPILFTFRTAKEGGEKEIAPEDYEALNLAVAESGYVDLIDVEAFTGDETVRRIIDGAHACGVKVVASNHDFAKTPPKEELVCRLCRMQEMGADIPKIAVMPRCRRDVLTLLEATLEMNEQHADTPIITMSMASDGVISRLAGEVFGSALTFGAAGRASAPGQIGVKDLKQVLEIIHESR